MTRTCDNCGTVFEAEHALRFCSKCLLASVSAAPDAGEAVPAVPLRASGASGLQARPDFFKRYDLIEKVGEGGQGAVWKVWDIEFRRFVAMKRLSHQEAASQSVLSRFLAEAQIASQLEHPGILPIFDVGLDPDGRPFYTTQLLPGGTLAEEWGGAEHRVGVAGALRLLERVCDVMAHAHARGVIHRDLKPSNILIGPFGDVRVIDWGSAYVAPGSRASCTEPSGAGEKALIETDRSDAMRGPLASPLSTASSGQPVTILYSPPEALRGEGGAPGTATDVYALGVMLYEMLAGRRPYAQPDGSLPEAEELKRLILAGPPAALRRTGRGIPRDLAAICEKAMARVATERYATMAALGADLRAVQEIRPVQARNPGPALRLQKWAQRHAAFVVIAMLVVAAAVTGITVARGLKVQRDAARQVNAMNSAELASRSGRWREALRHWDDAEAAGYRDVVKLSLLRAEAWVVLGDRVRAKQVYERLLAHPDLGPRRPAVFLRAGEFEMFDAATFERGMARVREARTNGLTESEQALADGLFADSSMEALRLFRKALELDPFFHAAHQHSLGLEYLLGRYEEAARHLESLKVLYPGEFSPGVLEAVALALHGRVDEAHATLDAVQGRMDPETLALIRSNAPVAAAVTEKFSFEVLSGERQATNSSQSEINSLILGLSVRVILTPSGRGLPVHASTARGLQDGLEALRPFLFPLLGNRAAAIERIKSAWRRHPDAFFPVYAAASLGESDLPARAELYQMGVDSHSIIPGLDRTALFGAVTTQSELAQSRHPNASAARANCITNLYKAALRPQATARESLVYYQAALELREFHLADHFLRRSEAINPTNATYLKARIKLENASGAFGRSLKRLNAMLSTNANDSWAIGVRSNLLPSIRKLAEEAGIISATNR